MDLTTISFITYGHLQRMGCQRKVEMSYSLQSRNVRFWPG